MFPKQIKFISFKLMDENSNTHHLISPTEKFSLLHGTHKTNRSRWEEHLKRRYSNWWLRTSMNPMSVQMSNILFYFSSFKLLSYLPFLIFPSSEKEIPVCGNDNKGKSLTTSKWLLLWPPLLLEYEMLKNTYYWCFLWKKD